MELTLPPHLVSILDAHARRRGISPEMLAVEVLGRQLSPVAPLVPSDEWERRLFAAAVDCGVSIPDAALSSDGLYE